MGLWIEQTLHVTETANIVLAEKVVYVSNDECDPPQEVVFKPKTRLEANKMAVAFKMVARHFEEMGKGLS